MYGLVTFGHFVQFLVIYMLFFMEIAIYFYSIVEINIEMLKKHT